MNNSKSSVSHVPRKGAIARARANRREAKNVSAIYGLALRFEGRAEGIEKVACKGEPWTVPFGWFTHFQNAVPQAPDLSWARRVKEWAKPQGVPIQLRVAGEAPWERIEQHRTIVPPRGYRQAEINAILGGNSQELLKYLHRVLHVEVTWSAKDAEAAAWCELLHAAERGFPAISCGLCGLTFIRPRTYPVKLCPTCRFLTWRQQARIRAMPKNDRVLGALDAALKAIKPSPAWRALPFQGGPEEKGGDR